MTPKALPAPAGRVTRDEYHYLRAVTEGVPLAESARRYLRIEHGAEALSAHRRVVDRVAAIARRRGDVRWRLLGIAIPAPMSEDDAPSVTTWAKTEGLEDWPEAELLALYSERFGPPDQASRRRAARNTRLRERRIALLHELEAIAVQEAKPSDLIDGWLAPGLVEPLRRIGCLTLGDLQQRMALGGHWWQGLPAYGPVKARRLAEQLRGLLGSVEMVVWPSPISSGEGGTTLSGRAGANRAPRATAGIEADDDRAAIRAWIGARAGSAATATQYEREAERFLLWCVLERHKALSDATAEDCRAFMDFITDVPVHWISRRNVGRLAPGWAPFRGALSVASQRVTIAALHSLFNWLVAAGYLMRNPWALVNRGLGDDPAGLAEEGGSRALTPAGWVALGAELRRMKPGPSTARLRWLCTFAQATGLRAAELLSATRSSLVLLRQRCWVRVHGKGRRNRVVPVPAAALGATRVYFASRGLDYDTAPAEAPLLASLDDAMSPVTYSALHQTFTRFVQRAAKPLGPDDRRHLEQASAHWLRHTHATRAAEQGVPLDVLQANLGQADPRTTARYYTAQLDRRADEMERAHQKIDLDLA